MKIIKMFIIVMSLAAFVAGSVWAEPKAPAAGQAQTTCPVLGGKVNQQVYADYKGKRIYFCCAGCDAEFKKDPEKYLKKLQAEGITLETCPAPTDKK